MAYALLFPGQGSQFVGMGADLFEARPDLLGPRVDESVGFPLRELCLEGPEERLTRTEHAQPALFALSYALWDELAQKVPPPDAAVGHSLGEYTALASAGVFSYDEALSLVTERGRAMSEAADAEPSTMAAVIGGEPEEIERICADRREEGGRLWLANVNAPGQVVVAGSVADVGWLEDEARELGLRRVRGLAVAGAFHSPYMAPAAERLSAFLERLDPGPGRFPVYSNVTGRPIPPGQVADVLVDQLVSPVRFTDCLQAMAAAGIHTFVHVGPGDVTAGLARRTVKGSTVVTVSRLDDVGEAVDVLGSMQ